MPHPFCMLLVFAPSGDVNDAARMRVHSPEALEQVRALALHLRPGTRVILVGYSDDGRDSFDWSYTVPRRSARR